jgi:hypothetical protein
LDGEDNIVASGAAPDKNVAHGAARDFEGNFDGTRQPQFSSSA